MVLVQYKVSLAVLSYVNFHKNLSCAAYLNPQTDALDF